MPRKKKITKNVVIKLSLTESSEPGFLLGVLRAPWPIKSDSEFSVRQLRQLLSGGKAKILHVLKVKKPKSIYSLAKELERDFKAVRQDLKLLEQFGFVRLIPEQDKKTGKNRLKPVIGLDKLQVNIEV
ncbi:MAG: HTH domain-containing protein [Candidatus Pacearchaeota archaeon]|nr:MAG: HTH domain-containing protein [Candidatus Pacearchaeota archaeon]